MAKSRPAVQVGRNWPGLSRSSSGRSRPAISKGGCGSWKKPMPRVRDGRIARLAAERTRFDLTTGLDNCTLRAWNRVCDLARDGLVRADIDPESATALQLAGMAAHMTDIADKPEARGRGEELAIGD